MTTWQAVENMGGAPGILEGALGSEPAVVNTTQNIGKLYVVSSGGAAKILRQGTTTWVKVAITDWADLDGKPSTFTPDLTAHLAASDPHPGYLTSAEADALYKAIGYVPAWTEITGKPATFPPDLTAHLAAADPHTQYQRESEKGAASGYAPLDASNLIPTAHIPALAISEVDTVASQAAMLALSAELGDIAIRTDFDPDRSYMLTGSDPTVLANWTRVTFGDVVSVNGQTGVIVLAATDVGAAPSSHVGAGGTAHSNAVAAGAAGFMTGADKTKLDGVESGAAADMTASEILTAIKTVDGPGSGLDADTLDGIEAAGFAPIAHVGAGGAAHANVVAAGAAGFLTGADKTKLDGIEANAKDNPSSAEIIGAFTGTPDGTKYLKDDGTLAAPTGGGSGFTPDWVAQNGAGSLFSASGYGDPNLAARELDMGSVAAPTGTNFGTTVARCVKFRLPKTLVLSACHLFGNAVLGSAVLQFAIYPVAAGSARLWQSATTIGATNAWVSFTGITGITLNANTDYWFCQLWNGSNTGAAFRTPPAPVHASLFGASAAPLGGRAIGVREYAQFTISAGVFPATLPAIASAAYASTANGSMPPAFLEGTAS